MVSAKKVLLTAAVFAATLLGLRYVLPVALPFLLAWAVAAAAEPLVRRLSGKMPRAAAAGVGVGLTLGGLVGAVALIGAVAVRELGSLARAVPDLEQTARQGITAAQDWLVSLAERTPENVRPVLQRAALQLFDSGAGLLRDLTRRIPGAAVSALSGATSGVLGLGTGVVAAFLISARLPKLKEAVRQRLPRSWFDKTLPAAKRVVAALGLWLKAQAKLCGVTWGVVTVGFFALGITHAPLWALLVAVVDAVPILGTGTILVPWAAVSLVQGQSLRAFGLFFTWGAATITRTVLEPRLVGRQLGLDPLVTLLALYVGYRFWGFGGLILAPILASAAKSLTQNGKGTELS